MLPRMQPRTFLVAAVGVAALSGLAACGSDPAPETATAASTTSVVPSTDPVIDPGDGGDYHATLTAADAVDRIDNPYFPLLPGSRWVYEGTADGVPERVVVEVLDERRTVMGISAVVVRDQAFVDGVLAEDTLDFFTQDAEGNVWYLGEETAEYEDGSIASTEGSWEAGVDGAQPGLVMPAHPVVGDAYRQEFLPGTAEDMGEVLATDGSVALPVGVFAEVVTTRDWTPLEPEVIEEKAYAPGVGLIQEADVAGGDGAAELVEFTAGR